MKRLILLSIALIAAFNSDGQILKQILTSHKTAAPSSPPVIDNTTNMTYVASGTVSTNHTATGTNLVGVLKLWTDGTAPTALTYGGASVLSLATSHAVTRTNTGTVYIYVGNIPSGSKAVQYTTAGQSAGTMESWSSAKQSGQPDSIATFVSGGTTINSAPICPTTNYYAPVPITPVAAHTAVSVWFGGGPLNPSSGNSDNGSTVAQGEEFASLGFSWFSTIDFPAGSRTFHGCANLGNTFDAIAISLAGL